LVEINVRQIEYIGNLLTYEIDWCYFCPIKW